MSRRLYLLVLTFTLVCTSVSTYSPAQAQYLTCKDCGEVIQAGLPVFFCQTELLMGFQDCFGPMLPTIPCSLWGPWTFCFLHGFFEDETLSLALDGSLNFANVSLSDQRRLTALRSRSASHPPAATTSRSIQTCEGVVIQRAFGSTVGATLRGLSQVIVL